MITFFSTKKKTPESHGITKNFIHKYLKDTLFTQVLTGQKMRNAFLLVLIN